jgi:hypothetical protein
MSSVSRVPRKCFIAKTVLRWQNIWGPLPSGSERERQVSAATVSWQATFRFTQPTALSYWYQGQQSTEKATRPQAVHSLPPRRDVWKHGAHLDATYTPSWLAAWEQRRSLRGYHNGQISTLVLQVVIIKNTRADNLKICPTSCNSAHCTIISSM